jgi:hypothetical protein
MAVTSLSEARLAGQLVLSLAQHGCTTTFEYAAARIQNRRRDDGAQPRMSLWPGLGHPSTTFDCLPACSPHVAELATSFAVSNSNTED